MAFKDESTRLVLMTVIGSWDHNSWLARSYVLGKKLVLLICLIDIAINCFLSSLLYTHKLVHLLFLNRKASYSQWWLIKKPKNDHFAEIAVYSALNGTFISQAFNKIYQSLLKSR